MLPLSEAQSKQIEALIAWGSIAYAAGFVTVTVYTARLGIPVIQILQPVYIWIGFPLALVIFSLGWLSRIGRARFLRAQDKYRVIRAELANVLEYQKQNPATSEDVVDLYIDLLSTSITLVVPLHVLASVLDTLLRSFRSVFIRWLTSDLQKENTRKQQQILDRYYSPLHAASVIFQGVSEAVSLLSFLLLLLLIPLACYAYIVFVYPTIPQSLGGGKPQPVVLMVKAEDVALYDPQISALFPAMPAAPTPPATRMTKQLDLLYATEQVYYVRAANGHIVSLAKDLVHGVLWNPP